MERARTCFVIDKVFCHIINCFCFNIFLYMCVFVLCLIHIVVSTITKSITFRKTTMKCIAVV
jgi:hypothetical protein